MLSGTNNASTSIGRHIWRCNVTNKSSVENARRQKNIPLFTSGNNQGTNTSELAIFQPANFNQHRHVCIVHVPGTSHVIHHYECNCSDDGTCVCIVSI